MRNPLLVLLLVSGASAQSGKLLHHWSAPDQLPGMTMEEIVPGRSAGVLDGKTRLQVTDDHRTVALPKRRMSVGAWVRVDRSQSWGGIVSCIHDNGPVESGWLLGFNEDNFCFALASKGADDGDGLLTYLRSSRTFTPGAWHHVVGTYDGKTMRLWVDGEPAGESAVQSGDILYPERTWFQVGAYKDSNEDFPMVGRIHSAWVRSGALDRRGVRRLWRQKSEGWPAAKAPPSKGITEAELAGPIDRGVRWLLSQQQADGSWPGIERDYYVGQTALCLYTLVKCGLPKDHPAVRAALSYLRGRDYRRTYDLGIVLMAFSEMKGVVPESEIRRLATNLMKLCGNGSTRRPARWGYPFGFSQAGVENGDVGYEDISNTQYALLGLRAAWKAGVKVGKKRFWERVASALVSDQGAYGGLGYRHRATKQTSSLTSAGVCSLVIVGDILEEVRGAKGIRGRVRAGINNRVMWFRNHWSVTRNINGGAAWYYYFMYGLERIGSYTRRDRLAERDWHSDGSRVIISRQAKSGRWGDGDMDTCFALLFLRRGSRSSGLGPRMRAEAKTRPTDAFVIGANGEDPLVAWVRRVGPDVRDALDTGAGTLRWEVDGRAAAEREGVDRDGLFAIASNLEAPLTRNGTVTITAFIDVKGRAKPYASNALELWIDGVEERWHREAVRDTARNLVPSEGVTASASSYAPPARWSTGAPGNVGDRRYASSWRCASGDRTPWVSMKLPKPVRASVMKLAVENVTEADITINGRDPFRVTLDGTSGRKQTIVFKTLRVRSVRVTIRGRKVDARGVGVKEIELFRDLLPEERGDVVLVTDRR